MTHVNSYSGLGRYRSYPLSIRRDTIVNILFVIYIVGAHLRLTIYNGGEILVPFYLMLFPALVLLPLYMGRLLAHAGGSIGLLVAFICAQPFATLAPSSGLGTLTSALQMIASVLTTSLILCALKTVDRKILRSIIFYMWITMIVLAIAESLGLKPDFDQIRDIIYSSSGRPFYLSSDRDLEIYGKVRSTVFASEPSFLCDTLCIMILLIYFLDDRENSKNGLLIRALLMMAVSFLLAPSLKMIFYMIAILVWHFWPQTRRSLTIMISMIVPIAILGSALYSQFPDFWGGVIGKHLSSGSFYGRISVAPIVGWAALKEFPILGYGIGNKYDLAPVIFSVWQESGAIYLFPWFQNLRPTDLMTNGFWWQWAYLGIFGGGIFVILVLHWLRDLGVENPFRTIVCVWIVWYSGFAFTDPVSWSMFVVFSIGAVGSKSLSQNKVVKVQG